MSVIDRFKEREEVRLSLPGDDASQEEGTARTRDTGSGEEDVTHFFNETPQEDGDAVSLPGTGNNTGTDRAERLADKLDTIIDQNKEIIALLQDGTRQTREKEMSDTGPGVGTPSETESLW